MQSVKSICRVAVAARNLSDAQQFAERWGFEKAYEGYEALLADPEVEVVYIGTPHAFHYEQIMRCLEHGKGVICEKAFCLNAGACKWASGSDNDFVACREGFGNSSSVSRCDFLSVI